MLVARGDFRADAQLLEGYSWLDKHAPTDAVVLADFDNSNQIPQYTHNRVFCGYLNAVEFDEKSKEQERFLGPDAPNGFRAQLISQNDIQFVLLTASEEQELKPLSGVLFTRQVFRNNAAVIFQVGSAENGAP